ncbi:hypothetical protein JZ751_016604 [Albula glossodonta]|uniref:Peptidase S1 domain-containing protein n=1 Tax=Albula glossodonta TaxID=121402 RepID=A0A8T2MJD1_9TELE|nr:hypothetical protein JZ751_016604 [Albula glossodonta]
MIHLQGWKPPAQDPAVCLSCLRPKPADSTHTALHAWGNGAAGAFHLCTTPEGSFSNKQSGAVSHTAGSPLITLPTCGMPSLGGRPPERVVGGASSVEGEWPWQVSLQFGGHLYCGASIISNEWLLSAAHCFSRERLSDPRQWSAHLGMVTQGAARHVAEVRRIVVHEYYNALTFDYDIALLQLKKPWPPSLSAHIQPICLPPPSQALTQAYTCWKAEVGVVSQRECKRRYGPVSPRMLCAGVPSGERDACRGDSGGPLSCRVRGEKRWFLTGIVSWGAGCGRPNLPGVYTRPWLNLALLLGCPSETHP